MTEDELCASEGFHEVEFLLPLFQDKYTECMFSISKLNVSLNYS